MNIRIKTTTLGAGSFKVVKEVQFETDKPVFVGIAMPEGLTEPIIEIKEGREETPIFGGGFSNN